MSIKLGSFLGCHHTILLIVELIILGGIKEGKCYRFQDINYTTATEDEQIGIFERYCKFLNSLDCNYKITINNKNKNMDELRDKVLIAEKNDGFNNYRSIYNDIIQL